MPATLKELDIYLSNLFMSSDILDYCPNGLQIEGQSTISRVGTAVSANLDTIEQAIDLKLDALIVHHGLFWNKDSYIIKGVKKQKIAQLLKHGISLFAYHLPMDGHREIGNNWKAAMELGLKNLKSFGSGKTPIGVQGTIASLNQLEMKEKLQHYYQHPAVCALGGNKIIQTVAIVSGGAHRMIDEAIHEKVDAFVTGSFDEPVWHLAHEENINFFALGHSATERIGPLALRENIEQNMNLSCIFIESENPF